MSGLLLSLALLLGVGCRDAQLDPFHQALADYDRGREAAEAGDWPRARDAFQAAVAQHPLSPALHLWLAEAHAQTGDLDSARAALGAGIERCASPELEVDLRYNRAAYAARAGDLEGAARDLQYLYARQLVNPADVGEDADFAPLQADDRFAELAPAPRVEAQLRAPVDNILLGERYTAEVALRIRAGATLSAVLDPVAVGAVQFVQERAIEDRVTEEAGWSLRLLTLDWRAVGSGVEVLGPVSFAAHGSTATVGPHHVEVTALPGQTKPPPMVGAVPPTLWLPSEVMAGHEAPWIGRLSDGRAAALMLPGMSAQSSGGGEPVRLEYREVGQTLWLAAVFPPGDGPVTVTILRGSREILRETL